MKPDSNSQQDPSKNLEACISAARDLPVPELLSSTEANVLRSIRLETARRQEAGAPAVFMESVWEDVSHQRSLLGYGLVLSAVFSFAIAQTQGGSASEEAVPDVRGARFFLADADPWERLLRTAHTD